MSRAMSVAVAEALGAEHVPFVMFVELMTDDPLRATTAPYSMQWDGKDWLGLGTLGGISQIEEGDSLEMYGISLTLSGIPTEYISTALGSHYQGRDCKVWVAPLSASMTIVADPVLVFHGRLDVMNIEIGVTATITVTAESRLADWNRARTSRYTHEEQQRLYPGDMGLQYVAQTSEMELVWGRT